MNQGIPFARTVRALDADDFRTSKLGLLLAAAVLAAWIWWALAARVPQYELSANVRLDRIAQSAVAYFPASIRAHLRPGQHAVLRTNSSAIDAQVTDTTETSDGQVRVNLRLSQPVAYFAQPITAELEMDRVSPATIALRAAGLWNK
jgi:hypothetical protein